MIGAFSFLTAIGCFGAAAGVNACNTAKIKKASREMESRRVSFQASPQVKAVYEELKNRPWNTRGTKSSDIAKRTGIHIYEYTRAVLLKEELIDRGIEYDIFYVMELTGLNFYNLMNRKNLRP